MSTVTQAKAQVSEAVKLWDPNKDPKIRVSIHSFNGIESPMMNELLCSQSDPFKTLFVSRLSYEVTDKKLRKEFEEFGPIASIKVVLDRSGKPRGYAFIEFEHKKDMKEAYKQADGRKIEGRRVVVDVERGRTVENW